MNYYPYFNGIPYASASNVTKTGFFKNLFSGLNLSSIINGTQKTLGIVNQAIPLIKQAKPVINNAKTMFRVMNEFKKVDTNVPTINENNLTKETSFETKSDNKTPTAKSNGPVFFQ